MIRTPKILLKPVYPSTSTTRFRAVAGRHLQYFRNFGMVEVTCLLYLNDGGYLGFDYGFSIVHCGHKRRNGTWEGRGVEFDAVLQISQHILKLPRLFLQASDTRLQSLDLLHQNAHVHLGQKKRSKYRKLE